MTKSRVPVRHIAPRNRARQSAARQIAAEQGVSYQQALRQVDAAASLPWWNATVIVDLDARLTCEAGEAYVDQIVRLCHEPGVLREDVEVRRVDATHQCASKEHLALRSHLHVAVQAVGEIEACQVLDAAIQVIVMAAPEIRFINFNPESLRSGRVSNTRLSYLYRDADNYKSGLEVVLAGHPDPATLRMVQDSLDEGLYFIPGQVGLLDLQGMLQAFDAPAVRAEDYDDDVDHPWHELRTLLGSDVVLTDREPTIDMTWLEFAAAMHEVVWNQEYVPE